MDFTEKRIDGEEKYKGVIVRVVLDRVQLCDGKMTKREVVEHPGGVCIPAASASCPLTKTGTAPWCASSAIPSGR